MTREEAIAEAARLGREDPERDRYSWLARPVGGADGWEVVRLGVPSRAPQDARTGREQRSVAPREDPRPALPPDQAGL